jgi:selenocysteine lyase/cysteine desulfurase
LAELSKDTTALLDWYASFLSSTEHAAMVENSSVAACLKDDDEDVDDSAVVYLNNSGQTRLSPAVQQAGVVALLQDPWISTTAATATTTLVREQFAHLIQADSTAIAIHPSTAFAVTMAAENIYRTWQSTAIISHARTKILLLNDQFASAVFPWQEICRKVRANCSWNLFLIQTILMMRTG